MKNEMISKDYVKHWIEFHIMSNMRIVCQEGLAAIDCLSSVFDLVLLSKSLDLIEWENYKVIRDLIRDFRYRLYDEDGEEQVRYEF